MNEVATINENSPTIRTPAAIATEINSIKEQTRKLVLFNSIEIGRLLTEAKSVVAHGEWGNWLSESVDYSQRTANNLMKIYKEYGSNQVALFGDNAKSQSLANLSYTQAVKLLCLPTEEREEFIEENNVDDMSTRELEQAIKEKQELEKKLEDAEKKIEEEKQHYKTVSDSYKRLEEVNKKHYETAEQLKKELEEAKKTGNTEDVEQLQNSLDDTKKELEESSKKIKELEQKLKDKPIDVQAAEIIEKIPEDVEKELQELREKAKQMEQKSGQDNNKAKVKFAVCFEHLANEFKALLGALSEIKETAPNEHEKYKGAVSGLIGKMSERL